MTNNKPHRKICVLNAATYAVHVLQSHGVVCVLVGPLAAFVHGSTEVPIDATLVIIQSKGSSRNLTDVVKILYDAPGQVFRVEGKRAALAFHDPTASPSDVNKRKKCLVRIALLSEGPVFQFEDLQWVNGLPVVSTLHLAVELAEAALQRYHQRRVSGIDSEKWLPKGRVTTIERLLAASNTRSISPIRDRSFNEHAIDVMGELSAISERAARLLRPLIHICMKQLLSNDVDQEYLTSDTIQIEAELPDKVNQPNISQTSSLFATNTASSSQIPHQDDAEDDCARAEGLYSLRKNTVDPKDMQSRQTTIYNAAFDTIRILQAQGVHCVIAGDMAHYLYVSTVNKVPASVEVAIIPGLEEITDPANICNKLCEDHKMLFKDDKYTTSKTIIRYFDPTAEKEVSFAQRSCAVRFKGVDSSTASISHAGEQQTLIHGLPVIGLLPFIAHDARHILLSYARWQGRNQDEGERKKEWRGFKQRTRDLLGEWMHQQQALQPVKTRAFNEEAIDIFTETVKIVPKQAANVFWKIMTACQEQLDLGGLDQPWLLDGAERETESTVDRMLSLVLDGKDDEIDSYGDGCDEY